MRARFTTLTEYSYVKATPLPKRNAHIYNIVSNFRSFTAPLK